METTESKGGFHILICLIKIWESKDPKRPMDNPDSPLLITEVERIEIEDSYRKLINTATVRFPIGTVIKKTRTEMDGEAYSAEVSTRLEGNGTLLTTRVDSKKANPADFRVKQRIRIMLGYTTNPKVAALAKVDVEGRSIHNDEGRLREYEKNLTTLFDGYITKCSVDVPIEIKCEDLASRLKKISCPKFSASGNMTVNDFLSSGGKLKLLDGSGLSLHPDTEKCDINIGKVNLNPDLTVADVLTEWSKYKVFAFVKDNNGQPCIAVGRSYFSSAGKDSVVNLKESESKVKEILFDYHVANNDLSLMDIDQDYFAVEASSLTGGKFYHITIRQNPNYDSANPNSSKWQLLNETKLSAKAMKLGATVCSKSKDKVDLSLYTVVPYMSRKIGISNDELVKEAIKFAEGYSKNGVEGSLTLFGDLALRSGEKVRLSDKRYPRKNGIYLVGEVKTQFGTGGYRQTIKLPYCIAREKTNTVGNDTK
jgi:hypothetical protein